MILRFRLFFISLLHSGEIKKKTVKDFLTQIEIFGKEISFRMIFLSFFSKLIFPCIAYVRSVKNIFLLIAAFANDSYGEGL
jgi:hypothetical protein